MITFTLEGLAAVRKELELFLKPHWWEIALNKSKIRMNPDWEKYESLDAAGILKIVCVRDDGRLIGYHVGCLVENPHYKGYKQGQTDIYYLSPKYRGQGIGKQMFLYVEESFKGMGAVLLVTATKLHSDNTVLFERLGWVNTEKIFQKYIGD